MVASDSHKQSGAYLWQNSLTPNASSDGSGSADFNDTSTSDYGKIDKG